MLCYIQNLGFLFFLEKNLYLWKIKLNTSEGLHWCLKYKLKMSFESGFMEYCSRLIDLKILTLMNLKILTFSNKLSDLFEHP